MIIKFHSRGRGCGSGSVDYLLGKDRDREGARLDSGDPEQMIQLIDSINYAQKYKSGFYLLPNVIYKNIKSKKSWKVLKRLC